MTYWRRSNYPANGHADVPDAIWHEFQRIRSAFMDVDQNNVLQNGVDRPTIVLPTAANHGGISRILNSASAFAYSSAAGTLTDTQAEDDEVWQTDGTVALILAPAWDAVWLVGFSASFGMTPAANFALCDLAIQAPQSGVTGAVASGVLSANQEAVALGAVSTMFLPGGTHTINLLRRVRWTGAAGNVTYTTRNLFAFALYR